MPITINDVDLESILREVEADFDTAVKNQRLRKADDEAVGDDAPGGDAPPDAPPGGDEASAPPPGAGGDMPPPGAGDPDAQGSAPPGADPAADQGAPNDIEGLKAEYAQLPPEELKMHYIAVKAALFAAMQQGGGAGPAGPGADPAAGAGGPPPMPGADPAAGAGAPPPPMAGGPPPAMKGEMTPSKNPNGGGAAMAKAEKLLADQQKQIEGLSTAVEMLLKTPVRKAVTNFDFIRKSEDSNAPTLTRGQIMEKLNEKAKDPKLAKSDRNLINAFCVSSVDASQIAHLLK
jgi:hypothetical protein